MIDSLHLKNFKCFRDQSIPLRGLNVLAGLNGAGKSSVIQAILLLNQRGEDLSKSGLWRTPLVNLGSFRDVLHEGADEDVVRLVLSLAEGATIWMKEDRSPSGSGSPPLGIESDGTSQAFPRKIFYLAADRLGPELTLPYVEGVGQSATPLGKRGEHVLWYLDERASLPVDPSVRHPGEPKNTLADQANAWLGVVSPGAALRVEAIPAADCAVASYSYEQADDVPSRPFRAGNVGFGVSYALPTITALLAPKRDRDDPREHLIVIENIEAHIHPAGQTALAELAARAVAGGSQVILETHSDHVLNGVRLAVAEGILEPDQVAIHYFERAGLDVRVTTPELNGAGRLDVWPEGFFDQHERDLSRLITASRASAKGI